MKKILCILAYVVSLPILAIFSPVIKCIYTNRLKGKILVNINGENRLIKYTKEIN
jgi:hypothetical protein